MRYTHESSPGRVPCAATSQGIDGFSRSSKGRPPHDLALIFSIAVIQPRTSLKTPK